MPQDVKSRRQVGYLLSSGSPLTAEQQAKLKGELHSGAVRVRARKDAQQKAQRQRAPFPAPAPAPAPAPMSKTQNQRR